jgi:tetratricopeptide (TPR) repeat protein
MALAALFLLVGRPACGQEPAPSLAEARLLLRAGSSGPAAAMLAELARANPGNDSLAYAQAFAWLAEGKPALAVEAAARAVELRGTDPACHLLLARAWRAYGLSPDSLTTAAAYLAASCREFRWALANDPANVRARYEYLEALLAGPDSAGRDLDEASRQAEILVRQDPLTGASARARVWEARQDPDRALGAIKEAAALEGMPSFRVSYNFGLVAMQRRHLDLAEAQFRDMLRANPADGGALYQLGRTLLLARRNLDEAGQCFRRYLRSWPARGDPTWAGAHWRLGMVYDLQGRREEAIREFKRSLRLNPDDPQVKKALALAEGRTREPSSP